MSSIKGNQVRTQRFPFSGRYTTSCRNARTTSPLWDTQDTQQRCTPEDYHNLPLFTSISITQTPAITNWTASRKELYTLCRNDKKDWIETIRLVSKLRCKELIHQCTSSIDVIERKLQEDENIATGSDGGGFKELLPVQVILPSEKQLLLTRLTYGITGITSNY